MIYEDKPWEKNAMKSRTTVEFLDEIKTKFSLQSDYALAKFLGMRQAMISRYRHGGTFDQAIAIMVAEKLEISVGHVLACIEEERAERTKRPEVKAAWHKVAQSLAPTIAAVAVAISLAGSPTPAQASSATSDDVYITRRKRRTDRPRRDFLNLPPTPHHPPIITKLSGPGMVSA